MIQCENQNGGRVKKKKQSYHLRTNEASEALESDEEKQNGRRCVAYPKEKIKQRWHTHQMLGLMSLTTQQQSK